jgi:hypothetical protein
MPTTNAKRPGHRRRWLWFATGFLAVFVGLSVGVTVYAFTPKADAVMVLPLWEYYVVEAKRATAGGNAMGPASGSSTRAAMTLLLHLLGSVAGGVVALGFRWGSQKLRRRPSPN